MTHRLPFVVTPLICTCVPVAKAVLLVISSRLTYPISLESILSAAGEHKELKYVRSYNKRLVYTSNDLAAVFLNLHSNSFCPAEAVEIRFYAVLI